MFFLEVRGQTENLNFLSEVRLMTLTIERWLHHVVNIISLTSDSVSKRKTETVWLLIAQRSTSVVKLQEC